MIERYSRPELAALWDDKYRFELWLEIELAVCREMERTGPVPAGTAEKVKAAAAGKLDAKRILEIEATTRHDVIAFLTHVEQLAGEPARWLHLGMTSSDVLDTCLALQLVRALDKIIAATGGLSAALASKARQHAKTPMIGRSHGIHAEPITAGLTFARWHAELGRSIERLKKAREVIAAKPGVPDSRANLVAVLLQKGEIDEAKTEFAKLEGMNRLGSIDAMLESLRATIASAERAAAAAGAGSPNP